MKIYLFLFILLLAPAFLFASDEFSAGVGPVDADSARARLLADPLQLHLRKTVDIVTGYAAADTRSLDAQMESLGCNGEACRTSLAGEAGLELFLLAQVQDRGSKALITVDAYAYNEPYNGKRIARYRRTIEWRSYDPRTYSYYGEELALKAWAEVIKKHGRLMPVAQSSVDPSLDGRFQGWNRGKDGALLPSGTVMVSSGRVERKVDFILRYDTKTPAFLEEYIQGRKEEIVFPRPQWRESFYMAVFSPLASASMPLVSPFFGYIPRRDWEGLLLWSAHGLPYVWIEWQGLMNSPKSLRENNESVSRWERTRHRFGWYMLVSGSMPLFVDSFSAGYLNEARHFSGMQRFMGNDATAVTLAVLGGGGGHFYKGYRRWGYLYYHANNLLLLSFLWSLSPEQKYNSAEGSWSDGSINTQQAWISGGLFALVKTLEILHLLHVDHDIGVDMTVSLQPVFYLEQHDRIEDMNLALQASLNF